MGAPVGELVSLDHLVVEWVQDIRWGPLTAIFVLASAWWVKGLVFAAVGGLRDVANRTLLPSAGLAAVAAFGVASVATGLIKGAVERERPFQADPGIEALAAPSGYSFPSAHTSTAFAAAMAVAVVCPRLRWPALGLAALIGASRMYMGVHYGIDVAAGAVLGVGIGAACGWLVVRGARALPARALGAS